MDHGEMQMLRIGASLAGFLLAASLFVPNTSSAADITLGASAQLTGPLANTGRYYKDAYEFTVDQIKIRRCESWQPAEQTRPEDVSTGPMLT
jgi:hypothetical protein